MNKRIPKQKRSIEKYESIIRTTCRIIDEDKFLESSTHKIARRAGVGVGTLYEYFDNKEDILMALLEYEARNLSATLETQVVGLLELEPFDAIQRFIEILIRMAVENRGLTKVMFGHVPGLMSTEPMIRLMAQGEMLVKMLVFRGRLAEPNQHTDALTYILMNSIIGLVLGISNGIPKSLSPELLAEQSAKVFDLVTAHYEVLVQS